MLLALPISKQSAVSGPIGPRPRVLLTGAVTAAVASYPHQHTPWCCWEAAGIAWHLTDALTHTKNQTPIDVLAAANHTNGRMRDG
jgi:hypothetical protein